MTEPQKAAPPRVPEPQKAAPPRVEERRRVQLEFSPEAFERLDEIKALADKRTNAEVVRSAIRLYEWFLQQMKDNYRIHLVKDDVAKEVELIL